MRLHELQLESWGTHMEDEVQVYILHNESCKSLWTHLPVDLEQIQDCKETKKICMKVKKQQLELDMEQQTIPNWERSMSRLYIVTLLI